PAPATGLVVANDADGKRCSLLTHQTKRMCSPALVVTNHEAQAFPLLRNLVPGAQERRVLFDRILCDEGGGRYRGVDPIVPFLDPQQLPAMRAFYGLAPQCPVPDALISRSTDPHPKKLYYVSPAVKLLLRQDAREQVKVTAAGVKILERQDSK
ncbi:hypothetical protein CHLNCDRAFT_55780, partial [Chlorella variabilis]